MIINHQFFWVEAMFYHCCLFINCLKTFGNLSLHFKLPAITSNIFTRHNSKTEHCWETRTEYSNPETTGCIKEGNETVLWCCNIKFSARQSGAETRLNVCTIFHYDIILNQKVFNSFSNWNKAYEDMSIEENAITYYQKESVPQKSF